MASVTDGRVLLGGKRADFQGELPGLIEEAIATLSAGRALYLAAGFGGVTFDIAKALDVDDGSWMPPLPGPPPDPRLTRGLEQLRSFAEAPGWRGLDNGLSVEENRRLAATHRPSDIAALVSLGLGRKLGGVPAAVP